MRLRWPDPGDARVVRALPRPHADSTIVGTAAVVLTLGLALDVGAGLWFQRAIGVATWLVLIALLRGEEEGVRAQAAVVVLFATAVEYTASPFLGLYTYRLGNVPAFVPPGHGLVYLAALALGRSTAFTSRRRWTCRLVLVLGASWAVYGVALAGRRDVLGMLLFLVLARFVLVGRAPLVYAAAFWITSCLELLGTGIGTWTWAERDPSGLVSIGNPPSGIPGGYCVLDAVALALGPAALRLARMRAPRLLVLRGGLAVRRP